MFWWVKGGVGLLGGGGVLIILSSELPLCGICGHHEEEPWLSVQGGADYEAKGSLWTADDGRQDRWEVKMEDE